MKLTEPDERSQWESRSLTLGFGRRIGARREGVRAAREAGPLRPTAPSRHTDGGAVDVEEAQVLTLRPTDDSKRFRDARRSSRDRFC